MSALDRRCMCISVADSEERMAQRCAECAQACVTEDDERRGMEAREYDARAKTGRGDS